MDLSDFWSFLVRHSFSAVVRVRHFTKINFLVSTVADKYFSKTHSLASVTVRDTLGTYLNISLSVFASMMWQPAVTKPLIGLVAI